MSPRRSSGPRPTVRRMSFSGDTPEPPGLWSDIAGAPEAGEDLASYGKVPVPERRAGHERRGRPGPAPQHLVVGAVEHFGVLLVGERGEAGVGGEVGRGPLPHVAQHLLGAVAAGAVGIGAHT